jgi:hydrogenase maturation factor HypF (carbamoyltransferase family)
MDGLAITVGAKFRNVAAVSSKGKCFMTPYSEDVTSLEALDLERGHREDA